MYNKSLGRLMYLIFSCFSKKNMSKPVHIILFILVLEIFSQTVSAQNGKVWVTIANPNDVPYYSTDSSLISNNALFNQYIQSLQIVSVSKPLPSSRKRELQMVYELECNCTQTLLEETLRSQVPAVSGVYPAPVYDTLHTPNDYSLPLGINNYALNIINAQQAWDITTGDSAVVIAITDQDYSATHSELLGKYVHLYQGGATPTHGNAVGILAAGNTNNNNGLSSIGYNCKLALYNMSFNEVLNAAYAGYKIINMSWCSGCFFSPYQQLCIDEAYDQGAFLIAAAGNGYTCSAAWNYSYPAAYDHVFAVTSIGQNDSHIQYGNDTTSTHQHNDMVDLSAPGYDVAINPMEGWYLNSSGTSYAAPIVSGTVGLMLSVNPCLSRKDIDTILKLSSTNIDAINPYFIGKIGAGKLNAYGAVQMASGWTTHPMTVTQQPVTAYALPGGNAQFTVTSSSSLPLYQWQRDSLGIFVNVSNNAFYSGVNTATLTVTGAVLAMNNQQYRCVMSSGLCQVTSNAATLVINNNIVFPDTAGPITYPTQVCFGDTIQLSIDTVSNATGYNWAVPANSVIISGQNTTIVTIVVYDTVCTVSVTPVNTYGSGPGSSVTIHTGPFPTASFSGNATICQGASAVLILNLTGNAPWSGFINGSIPFSTTVNTVTITVSPSVTTDYILTELTAGYCPGFPDYFSTMATVTVIPPVYDTVTVSVCNNQLPYLWQGMSIAAAGYYNDTLLTVSGCDSILTLHLTLMAGTTPAAPLSVLQTIVTNQCYARVYRYTAAITANATGYQWQIPASCGGIGPVIVDSGDINSSRIIRLKYFSNNAAYFTDSIRVRAYNMCGNGPWRSAKLVNIALNVPSTPASIVVTPLVTNICGQRKYRYTAPDLPQATASNTAATGYYWSFTSPLPLQAQIDSGTVNSKIIVVKYLSNAAALPGDSICLQYTSACGNSLKRSLKINLTTLAVPIAPASITITTLNNNICGNRKYRLTMPVITAAGSNTAAATGYLWSFTGNVASYAIIDSGSLFSRQVVIRYTNDQGTTAGDSIKAQYQSDCGNSSFRAVKFSIQQLNPPAAPSYINITAVAPTVCGARIYRYTAPPLPTGSAAYAPATGYSWSFTGALGLNAVIDSGSLTGQVIKIKYTSNANSVAGDSVRVRFASSCGFSNNKSLKLTNTLLFGCPPIITTKKIQPKLFDCVLFPNPATDAFHLQLSGSPEEYSIRILDLSGRCLLQKTRIGAGSLRLGESLRPGIYLIELSGGGEKRLIKAVKQ